MEFAKACWKVKLKAKSQKRIAGGEADQCNEQILWSSY